MADEQYRWLDREAAERLLRGEPLAPAVDATVRDRAGRLAETLGALSTAAAAPDSTELPGEAAAMAAFRAARGAERPAVGRRARTAASRSADAGLVRLGRPAPAAGRFRWGRPVRLGLSAALAAGMVGGVAVAAGTGVLPAPFGGVEPGPAVSVSAAASPARPLVPPSPGDIMGGTSGVATPDDRTSASPGGGPTRGADDDALAGDRGQDDRAATGSGSTWSGVAAACRDLRAGREPVGERRRALEKAAGGSPRVWKYCKTLLGNSLNTGQDGNAEGGPGAQDGSDGTARDGSGDQGDKGDKDSRGEDGDGRGSVRGSGDGPRDGALGLLTPSLSRTKAQTLARGSWKSPQSPQNLKSPQSLKSLKNAACPRASARSRAHFTV
ncbi:hypothetical protein [Streptomyces adustus]